MLYAARCSSPMPHGEWRFVEDRDGPPNRALPQFCEALTRPPLEFTGAVPGGLPTPGDICLRLGASPGGWTWVLANRGAAALPTNSVPLAPAGARPPGWEGRR